jgi:hypothetical protein
MQYQRAVPYEANPIAPVRIWRLLPTTTKRGTSFQARWKVGREVFSRTFDSPAVAERFT